MKWFLVISVVTNVFLGALVLYLASRDSIEKNCLKNPSIPATNTNTVVEPKQTELIRGAEATTLKPEQFQWNELESTNYRVYVGNLRNIGCPEQTIRDIITADVHSLFAQRLNELDQKKMVRGERAGQLVVRTVEEEMNSLRNEEASVISAALDTEPPASTVTNPQRSFRNRSHDLAVSMPLIFQQVDAAGLKLDGRQLEVISDLRARFQEDIGGPNQDPNDPAYRERWKTAQRKSDDMLAGMLGGQFFVEYQLHAAEAGSHTH